MNGLNQQGGLGMDLKHANFMVKFLNFREAWSVPETHNGKGKGTVRLKNIRTGNSAIQFQRQI